MKMMWIGLALAQNDVSIKPELRQISRTGLLFPFEQQISAKMTPKSLSQFVCR
jgi:hypothetical protein